MTTDYEAAKSLLARAMEAGTQAQALILIMAAGRLDPTVDTSAAMVQWIEKWLEDTHTARTN